MLSKKPTKDTLNYGAKLSMTNHFLSGGGAKGKKQRKKETSTSSFQRNLTI